jgi:hypothetical protein
VKTALAVCLGSVATVFAVLPHAGSAPATPEELVSTYNSLADGILALNKSEKNIVNAILATAYRHAEGEVNKALAKVKAGQPAKEEIEAAAALVSQLGNEGDAAVAGIRKRLVEGGHHHNAAGEQQGIFDEGFVVVTRNAKKDFLAAAGDLGKMAGAPTADGLAATWGKVASRYAELRKSGR